MKYATELNRLIKLYPDAKLIQRVVKCTQGGFVELMLLPVAGHHYSTGGFEEGAKQVNAICIN